ncbi:hypothetical protein [Paenibacillus medicaginis]|uniref:Fibronectin type-III domain-containing protein n=1 Tax=Paenibacillus medicaginis TaxID=1470560 RepID=A0ABV5BYH6_9BACL
MALQRPYNINITGQTIAAEEVIKVTWQVTGDISTAYQVRIYLNSTGSMVYDSGQITSFAQSHNIPANAITNGSEFKIAVTIYNSNESISSLSQIFQTSSRPKVSVGTIGTVKSNSYRFTATYSQAEANPIRSWVMYLYNEDRIRVQTSPISTNSSIEYIFSSLESGADYYIEIQVTSAKGLTGTSGLIPFDVQYRQPNVKINLTTENTDDAGIKILWNVIQIIGETTKPPIFTSDGYLDLTDDTLTFSEGFSVDQDFTIKIWMRNIKPDKDLFFLKGKTGTITVQYWSDDHKFHVFKDVYGYRSHYASPEVVGIGLFCCIQQIFCDMNVFAEVLKI